MKKFCFIVVVVVFLFSGMTLFAGGEQEAKKAKEETGEKPSVEVLHWWTSGGEAAALRVLKEKLEEQGIEWVDAPVAGGSGEQAMTALRSRVTAGNPPAAVQMLGYNIRDWAKQGVLANLNDLAEKENWGEVIPEAIQKFSKYEGQWIAAPVNIHSSNWVWGNKKILDEIGVEAPIRSWDEYVSAMQKAQDAGYIGLAHGGKPWQTATAFDAVVISVGGPEFYRAAFIEQSQEALKSDQMVEAFRRMKTLRGFVDENFSGRDWNLATAMVIEGDALFQMMGDWAKGEFFNADKKVGEDFVGFRSPGNLGTVTFNSDQFVMFEVEESKRPAQQAMAAAVMDPEFQIAFNTRKGSVPARMDVSMEEFTSIGKKGMEQVREAAKNGTLMGSMSQKHVPIPVMQAIYDVVSAHFNGQYSGPEEAAQKLAQAVKQAQE
jgi:glucose/mannose transport system substrate-binding protein